MPFPPIKKTMEGLLEDLMIRLNLVERRLAITGGSSGGGSGMSPGFMIPFGGGTVPVGWLLCDGSAVSRATYADLFAIIGTTYGAGNGSTTFNLPDMRGRFPVGQDTGQTEFDVLGEAGGAKTHSHTLSDAGQAQISLNASTPQITQRRVATAGGATTHQHTATGAAVASGTGSMTSGAALAGTTDAASSLPPYRVTQWIIATGNGPSSGGGSIAVGPGLMTSGTNPQVISVQTQLQPDLPALGSGVDLNNVVTTGWYIQNTSASATLALNYPVARAGHLEVSAGLFDTGSDFVLQTYTEYNAAAGVASPLNRQWRRTKFGSTWDSWLPVGDVRGDTLGLKMCSGTATLAASIASLANGTVAVTFPVGFFSAPPVNFILSMGNGRCTLSWTSVTATGFTISASNWSNGAMPAGQTVLWTAIGVGP